MINPFRVSLQSENAQMPERQNREDVGYDLVATGVKYDENIGVYIYDTGIHIQVPDGHAGIIVPRSSVYKKGLILANNVGVIDRGYRGEIKVLFVPIHRSQYVKSNGTSSEDGGNTKGRKVEGVGHTPYQIGERIAQLILMPVSTPTPVERESLSASERGKGGFGSTGDK